jgi:hypothetical protein
MTMKTERATSVTSPFGSERNRTSAAETLKRNLEVIRIEFQGK